MPAKIKTDNRKTHYSADEFDRLTYCGRRTTGLLRSADKREVTCSDCNRILWPDSPFGYRSPTSPRTA